MLTVGEVLGLSPGTTLLVCARNSESEDEADEAFWLCDLLRCNPDNETVHVQWYTVSQMSRFDPAPAARRWVKTPFQRHEVDACIVYQWVEVFAPGFRAYRLTEDSVQRFEDALNELAAAEAGNPSSREVSAPGHGHNQHDGHGGRRLARDGGTTRSSSPVTSKGVN
jgi:hypothetical protein